MINIISQSPISPIQDILKFLSPKDVSIFRVCVNLNQVTSDAIMQVLVDQEHIREFRIRVRQELLQDAVDEKPINLTIHKYKKLLFLINEILTKEIADEFANIKLGLYVLREAIKLKLKSPDWRDSINYLKKVMHNYDEPDALIGLLPLVLDKSDVVFDFVKEHLSKTRYNYYFLKTIVKYLQRYDVEEHRLLGYYDNMRIYKLSNPSLIKIVLNDQYANSMPRNKEDRVDKNITAEYLGSIFGDLKNKENLFIKLLKHFPHILTTRHLEAVIKFTANYCDATKFKNLCIFIKKRPDLFSANIQQHIIEFLNLNNNKIKDFTLELLYELARNNFIKINFISKIDSILSESTSTNYSKTNALYLLSMYLDEHVKNIEEYLTKLYIFTYSNDTGLKKAAADVLLHLFTQHENHINKEKHPLIFKRLHTILDKVKLKAKALYPNSPFFNTYENKVDFKIDLHNSYEARFFNFNNTKVLNEIRKEKCDVRDKAPTTNYNF